jgi:hypothetical protein
VSTYSDTDFERIGKAIGKGPDEIAGHKGRFEKAAEWYRISLRPRGRVAPTTLKRKLDQVQRTARRLLRQLGIQDEGSAPDGPEDQAIFDALMFAESRTEDDVANATARIGCLVKVFDAIGAAMELERLASVGGNDVIRIAKLMGRNGHHGDFALRTWTELMASLYRDITGKAPQTSVAAPGRKNQGVAQGPFIRFLMAASRPLGIDLTENAWRSRFRTTQKS